MVLETLASGITELPINTFVVLMQPIHLAIGLVEGIVMSAILWFVYSMRPEILESSLNGTEVKKETSVKKVVIILAVATLLVGGGLSWFASSNPDGLEWAMERTAGTTELEVRVQSLKMQPRLRRPRPSCRIMTTQTQGRRVPPQAPELRA